MGKEIFNLYKNFYLYKLIINCNIKFNNNVKIKKVGEFKLIYWRVIGFR